MDDNSSLCAKNQGFMMRYMDSAITDREMASLKAHMELCESCREDFAAYERMLAEFAGMELSEAPAGFELAVMAKIGLLPAAYDGGESRLDTLICLVWGSLSVVSGVGMLLYVNRESVMQWAGDVPTLSACVDAFEPVSEAVTGFFAQCGQLVDAGLDAFGAYSTMLQLVLMGVFSALALAQFFIYRKEKVKAS